MELGHIARMMKSSEAKKGIGSANVEGWGAASPYRSKANKQRSHESRGVSHIQNLQCISGTYRPKANTLQYHADFEVEFS